MKTRFFATARGSKPVQEYIDKQEVREVAQLSAVLEEVQRHGLVDGVVETRHIRGKLWEIKVSRHRLFYFVDDAGTLVLLHAAAKQGQRTPHREIETALARLAKEVPEGSGHGARKKRSPSTRGR